MILHCDKHSRYVDTDNEPDGCKWCDEENHPEDLFWMSAYIDPVDVKSE